MCKYLMWMRFRRWLWAGIIKLEQIELIWLRDSAQMKLKEDRRVWRSCRSSIAWWAHSISLACLCNTPIRSSKRSSTPQSGNFEARLKEVKVAECLSKDGKAQAELEFKCKITTASMFKARLKFTIVMAWALNTHISLKIKRQTNSNPYQSFPGPTDPWCHWSTSTPEGTQRNQRFQEELVKRKCHTSICTSRRLRNGTFSYTRKTPEMWEIVD